MRGKTPGWRLDEKFRKTGRLSRAQGPQPRVVCHFHRVPIERIARRQGACPGHCLRGLAVVAVIHPADGAFRHKRGQLLARGLRAQEAPLGFQIRRQCIPAGPIVGVREAIQAVASRLDIEAFVRPLPARKQVVGIVAFCRNQLQRISKPPPDRNVDDGQSRARSAAAKEGTMNERVRGVKRSIFGNLGRVVANATITLKHGNESQSAEVGFRVVELSRLPSELREFLIRVVAHQLRPSSSRQRHWPGFQFSVPGKPAAQARFVAATSMVPNSASGSCAS